MPADVLFTGGAVFTGTGEPLRGHAVVVTGDRITAVVPESEASALIGEGTRVVDLGGALLSPGFQDAHVHPLSAGVELLMCNLTEATDAADAVALVKAYADANPDEAWIQGGGWSMDHFPGGAPVRTLLDAVVPDRPVVLMSRDHHSTWANTAAITAAGVDATTPDPADGRIEREADGTPAGTFHEGASDLFGHVRPAIGADLAYAGLLRAQDELIALGITGWQDAWIGSGLGGVQDVASVYRRALLDGTLRAHVVGAQWWERAGGLEQVEEMAARRAEFAALDGGRFTLGTTKIMVDGVAENQTAAMLTPYRDVHGHDTTNSGLSFIDPERLREIVTQLDRAGFQVHFHALGDRAVREALDAVEAARLANGPTDGRHHLAHLQVVEETETARFADLDAVANIQALWATHEDQIDELTLPFLQDGAEARQYPFGDLVRNGARLAAGSDWPVSSADPMDAIHIAVTRVAPGSDDEPLGGAHQRLDLATAMAAYTSGTAWVNHRDHDTGHVREGYLANLVVLDPDPFSLPADEIHRSTVESTWIEGELVYSRTT
ncbi:amidohydrolase [Agromyces mariniharenae]|uniref:Amidohydrolase family protein n=1 Tax=Agromyces mariniharenae TaxID=2604423 RepID=A0A5S4V9M9_9MICO|nr:amidohydrolase [Agromyces mariniharenae]TYL53300.1 amidohydrolase family protein [Agromyces mariniharenae]